MPIEHKTIKMSSKLNEYRSNSINRRVSYATNQNPTISSLSLAKKLDIPPSTLQRRRAKVEKAILKKTYTFDYKSFGARVGDLIVNVDKGRSEEVAQSILRSIRIMS